MKIREMGWIANESTKYSYKKLDIEDGLFYLISTLSRQDNILMKGEVNIGNVISPCCLVFGDGRCSTAVAGGGGAVNGSGGRGYAAGRLG